MEIFNIVVLCIVSMLIVSILRRTQKEIAIVITVIFGVLVFILVVDKLAYIVEKITEMSTKISYANTYIKTLLKMTGIALISEYTASVCKDSGEKAIARKLEFAGKILILFLSLPLILGLFEVILKFLK
ncbi:stage III sporulation protein AD [Caldicellulosiruptor changbaiensis]|uniref:Stage III sporulation protein AD n=1 Tax=Caldicellulosiruptor changbaiensis TaxID=1222016 RepID=A0A3T0D516_9FIRM|nr:stage III sporulation protein AD [Caldicellulosiruptor changbaiensis]AZT90139.1 stage III sporulation protein AD [Caldicellulosiruptor changbaiensis]